MWVRYRHKWAYGVDKTWEWNYLGEEHPQLGESPMPPLKEAWEEFIRSEQVPVWEQEYEWSDKYRGVEFEVVEKAPREVIEEKWASCERQIQALTERLAAYDAMLKEG